MGRFRRHTTARPPMTITSRPVRAAIAAMANTNPDIGDSARSTTGTGPRSDTGTYIRRVPASFGQYRTPNWGEDPGVTFLVAHGFHQPTAANALRDDTFTVVLTQHLSFRNFSIHGGTAPDATHRSDDLRYRATSLQHPPRDESP